MRHLTRLFQMAVVVLVGGCSPSVDPGIGDIVTATPEPDGLIEDLGAVLVDGRPLEAAFVLKNPGLRPIRILESQPLRPCCSSFGAVPEIVEPGQAAVIPLRVRTSGLIGPFRADFSLTTDSPDRRRIMLTLLAHFVEEYSVVETSPAESPVIGRATSRHFRLTTRRPASTAEPLGTLTLDASPGLVASLDKPAWEQIGPAGSIESIRDLVVRIPAVERAGPQSGQIRLHVPGGREWTHNLRWEVVPNVRVLPKAVFVKAAEKTIVSVAVRSADGPFRLLSADGPILTDHRVVAGEGTEDQRIELSLDPSRTDRAATSVDFATDDPRSPRVSLSVIVPR